MVRTDDVLAGYGTHGTAAYAARAPLTRSRLQHGGTTKEASRHKQSSKQAASNQEVKQVKRPTFFQLPTSTPPSNQRGWLLAVRFSSSPPPLPPFFFPTTVPYGIVFTFPPGRYIISYILLGRGATPGWIHISDLVRQVSENTPALPPLTFSRGHGMERGAGGGHEVSASAFGFLWAVRPKSAAGGGGGGDADGDMGRRVPDRGQRPRARGGRTRRIRCLL